MSDGLVTNEPTMAAVLTMREQHQIQRLRTFCLDRLPVVALLDELNSAMHKEKATGRLIVHYTNGTAGAIQFEESTKLLSTEAPK